VLKVVNKMEEIQTKQVPCLDCDSTLEVVDDIEIGDILVCEGCGVELEVVNNNPTELDYLYVQK